MSHPVFYGSVKRRSMDSQFSIAKQGPKDAPTILSCFMDYPLRRECSSPSSSRLSDRYHLIACPITRGSDTSDWPEPDKVRIHVRSLRRDHESTSPKRSGCRSYTLYMQDYGGPVGFRMALAHSDRIVSLIVQDAVAHNTGLGPIWKTRRAFWADRAANESALRTNLLSLATTRTRHVGSDPKVETL